MVGSRSDLGELQETRVLNRIIRWTARGWEYEADQRHAELIIREMGMEGAKSVKTPGEDVPSWKLDTEEEYLEGAQATTFRGIVARANYLSADRMNIQYAVKECSRGMANPPAPTSNNAKQISKIPGWKIQDGMGIPVARG